MTVQYQPRATAATRGRNTFVDPEVRPSYDSASWRSGSASCWCSFTTATICEPNDLMTTEYCPSAASSSSWFGLSKTEVPGARAVTVLVLVSPPSEKR